MIRELKEENEKLRAKLKGGKLDKEDMVAMGASEGMSDEGTLFNKYEIIYIRSLLKNLIFPRIVEKEGWPVSRIFRHSGPQKQSDGISGKRTILYILDNPWFY